MTFADENVSKIPKYQNTSKNANITCFIKKKKTPKLGKSKAEQDNNKFKTFLFQLSTMKEQPEF
jgi:hypothetical protein